MKKIIRLTSATMLFCAVMLFQVRTKEYHVISDIAYDKNKEDNNMVYIREGSNMVPFLVLTSDYNGKTLLLRKEVLEIDRKMDSYEAYYENSFIDDYLNCEYIKQIQRGLPVLESEIKITDKKSLGVSGTDTRSIKRKIFLLAYSEIIQDEKTNVAPEGKFVTFFKREEHRIAFKENRKSSWWLRTPNTYYNSCVYVVGANNKIGSSNAYDKNGVRPAFCVSGHCKIKTDRDGYRYID